MRQLCIIGLDRSNVDIVAGTEGRLELEGQEVRFGVIETPDLTFDPDLDSNAEKVLMRVRAFSCNYRDRALILAMTRSIRTTNYYVVGSEFVGEVLATGRSVTEFKPGDRVIADGAYPDSGDPTVAAGLPTNHGSRELQILHRRKLIKIPSAMSDEFAAAFTIGAQTSYSMVRRLQLQKGDRVLVAAAKSNTSLFALAALKLLPVRVYALSTSRRHEERLMDLGVAGLVTVDPTRPDWSQSIPLSDQQGDMAGPFDAIIDPFADIYLGEIVKVMAQGGRYITCGVADQHSTVLGKESTILPIDASKFAMSMLFMNLTVMGNCLGRTSDLQAALDDFAAGRLVMPQPTRISSLDPKAFLEQTYLQPGRFGKVTCHYD